MKDEFLKMATIYFILTNNNYVITLNANIIQVQL